MKFIELSRSNFFFVKDVKLFERFCEVYNLIPLRGVTGTRKGKHGFIVSDGKKAHGDSIFSFKKELADKHLEKGEVCVIRTITFTEDSVDDIFGRVIAISSSGKEITIDLDDIYLRVEKEWGEKTTTALGYE